MTSTCSRIGGRLVAAIAGALAMAVAVAAPGLALWNDQGSATATFSTGSVPAPTNPSAARHGCTLLVSASFRVGWTASPSPSVTGYRVSYGLIEGGPYTSSTTVGADATSAVVGGLGFSLKYHVVVTALTPTWSSAPSSEVTVTTHTSACL